MTLWEQGGMFSAEEPMKCRPMSNRAHPLRGEPRGEKRQELQAETAGTWEVAGKNT